MNIAGFIARYEAILKERGIPKMDFYRACGFSDAAASQWRRGKNAPSMKNIERIAEYLNVSPEYLLTGQVTAEPLAPATEGEAYWAERLSRLTPSDQALLGAVAARLRETPEATRAALGLLLAAVQSSPRVP